MSSLIDAKTATPTSATTVSPVSGSSYDNDFSSVGLATQPAYIFSDETAPFAAPMEDSYEVIGVFGNAAPSVVAPSVVAPPAGGSAGYSELGVFGPSQAGAPEVTGVLPGYVPPATTGAAPGYGSPAITGVAPGYIPPATTTGGYPAAATTGGYPAAAATGGYPAAAATTGGTYGGAAYLGAAGYGAYGPSAGTAAPAGASGYTTQFSEDGSLIILDQSGAQVGMLTFEGDASAEAAQAIQATIANSPLAAQAFVAASQSAGSVNINTTPDRSGAGAWAPGERGLFAGQQPNTLFINPALSNPAEFGMVAVHELGHMLGLQHGEALDAFGIQVGDQLESTFGPETTQLGGANDVHQFINCATCDPDLQARVNASAPGQYDGDVIDEATDYDQRSLLGKYGTEEALAQSGVDFNRMRSFQFSFDPSQVPGIAGMSGSGILQFAPPGGTLGAGSAFDATGVPITADAGITSSVPPVPALTDSLTDSVVL